MRIKCLQLGSVHATIPSIIDPKVKHEDKILLASIRCLGDNNSSTATQKGLVRHNLHQFTHSLSAKVIMSVFQSVNASNLNQKTDLDEICYRVSLRPQREH